MILNTHVSTNNTAYHELFISLSSGKPVLRLFNSTWTPGCFLTSIALTWPAAQRWGPTSKPDNLRSILGTHMMSPHSGPHTSVVRAWLTALSPQLKSAVLWGPFISEDTFPASSGKFIWLGIKYIFVQISLMLGLIEGSYILIYSSIQCVILSQKMEREAGLSRIYRMGNGNIYLFRSFWMSFLDTVLKLKKDLFLKTQ